VNRNILALDLGTKTGWAIATRDGKRICGTESFVPRASWSPGQRGLRFRSWLAGMVVNHQITGIWYEIVHRHIGTQAAHLYGAYEMLMFMVADQNQLTVDSVGVGTIKKHAAGSGRADKHQMIDAMRLKGWIVDSDNAADAAAIMGWALDREVGIPVSVPKPATKAKVKAVQPQVSLL
jgi:Holliday junction resolvasome RuvABC endonuclease subunit